MNRFLTHFEIDGKMVGESSPVYIIAEAGVAHFGSEEKAYKLVDLAAEAGADAVKFQVFDVDAMIAKELGDWKERLGSRQLPYQAFERIQSYCREKKITFFATAHDEPSLDFLASLSVPAYKIGSGEVGNWPFFKRIASIGKPIIFSTGMYQIDQIGEALDIIESSGNQEVAVLHCVTRYPTPPNEVSLGNIDLIHDIHNVITGYSDHTEGYHIPLASIGLGARIIEKHITLDFNIPDAQDWKVSCGPDDLGKFVNEVREIEAALPSRKTGPTMGEQKNLEWASKSLVIRQDIPAGTILTAENFLAKRPGTGISPSQIDKVIGRRSQFFLRRDEILKWEDLR